MSITAPALQRFGSPFSAILMGCLLAHAGESVPPEIADLRMGKLVIQATPGAPVKVEQLKHEFWFGAALASQAFDGTLPAEDAERYRRVFLENFNAAVTENALKWQIMERRPGEVNYRVVDAILDWTESHDIPLRGHNLFWGVPQFVQPWVKELSDEQLRHALEARARDIGRRYRGRFAEYDLNNEMLHANYYEERLGPQITRSMADWLLEEDPGAQLFLNDYHILDGRRLDDFRAQIQTLRQQQVRFHGLGAQGHSHGDSFDAHALRHALDQLGEVGLPVRITEFNFPGQASSHYGDRRAPLTEEEEQVKAQAVVDYYRICFAHPAVHGILMWGFWEGAHWLPASALFRRDWSPTPAADAYHDLVFRQWWTRWQGQTDAQGLCVVPAFFGQHRVEVDGIVHTMDLQRSRGTVTLSLQNAP